MLSNSIYPKAIFLGGLFLLPFVFLPHTLYVYEVPKVWFFIKWIQIFALCTIVSLPRIKKLDKELMLLVSIFIFWIFLASFQGVDFNKSFWGNPWRLDGLFTQIHLFVLLLLIYINWGKGWMYLTSFFISTSNALLCLLAILFYVFSLFNFSTLPFSGANFGFGNENFLAGYLLVTLPFVFYVYKNSSLGKDKKVWKFVILLQIITILFSFSQASIFGVILFFLYKFPVKLKYKITVTFFFFSFLGVLMYLKDRDSSEIYIGENRNRIFAKGIIATTIKPLSGWGIANFDYVFSQVEYPDGYKDQLYVDKAHSMILEILVTTGVVGLSLYILILSKIIFNLNSKSKTYLAIFVLYLYHSQTNVISINEEIMFWIFAGIACQKDEF